MDATLLNLCVKVTFSCLEVNTSLESVVKKTFRQSPLTLDFLRVRVKYVKSYFMENIQLEPEDKSLGTYQKPNRPNISVSEINLHLNNKKIMSASWQDATVMEMFDAFVCNAVKRPACISSC